MPKKSKREKMLADIRRRARTERVITVPAPSSPIREQASTFRFTTVSPIKPAVAHVITDTGELVAIKKDLNKTAVLSIIAIAAELVLYWFGRGKM